jgi:benzoate-CoA ligase
MLGEWISTGDRYHLDEDGFYWYKGRADDMVKIGGEWVSPIEIENVLLEHPAVLDVAITGCRVDDLTRIRALIVPVPGHDNAAGLAAELQAWCKSRLQRYQYPHHIEFVDHLPRTAIGKIERFRLREQPRQS